LTFSSIADITVLVLLLKNFFCTKSASTNMKYIVPVCFVKLRAILGATYNKKTLGKHGKTETG
jgi:hypothetical protein